MVAGAPLDDDAAMDGGSAWVIAGTAPAGPVVDRAMGGLLGTSTYGKLGYAVSGADADGDGWSDMLVGEPRADLGAEDGGAAWLRYGPVSGVSEDTASDLGFISTGAEGQAGWSVGVIPGSHLVVSAPADAAVGENAGAVYLLPVFD